MDIDKIRNILNLFFMLLALLAVIFYFTMTQDQRFFLYTCGAAIVTKMAESFMRFTKITKPNKDKNSDYDKRRYHQA